MRDEVPGSRYAVSDKGWIDQKLFYSWLKDHFLPSAASHRPLLLLLDGHSSHFEPQSIEFAKEHDIVIFCLPPHTTHECQPLDVGLFGPLKKSWQQECHKFYQNNHGIVITKLNFNRVFREAWLKAISPLNVCGGFRKSGVFPFNRDAVAVLSADENEGDSDSHGDCNSDGTMVIPHLFPPSHTRAHEPPFPTHTHARTHTQMYMYTPHTCKHKHLHVYTHIFIS